MTWYMGSSIMSLVLERGWLVVKASDTPSQQGKWTNPCMGLMWAAELRDGWAESGRGGLDWMHDLISSVCNSYVLVDISLCPSYAFQSTSLSVVPAFQH